MENKIHIKVVVLFFIAFLFNSPVFAGRYWIEFKNKSGSPYSINNPSAFLSARSIQRRLNQMIPVTLRDIPVNPSYVAQVAAVANVTIHYRSRWFNAISISTNDTNAINTIKSFSFVQSVSQVARYKREPIKENSYSSAFIQTQKNQGVINYGNSLHQLNMLGGLCLHSAGFLGEGMVIAVLDAGFDNVDSLPVFDSLRTNNQILGTWNFISGNANVYGSHSHGMTVLSCMGGYLDGELVGTAPKAKYWLLMTEDVASELTVEEDNWVAAAEFADSVGADLINTSLGYTEFDDASQNYTYADMNGKTARISIASNIATQVGMLPVCSAGNSGSSPWRMIGAPADAIDVLTVGAVDSLQVIAGFSSHGPSSDGRVKPDVCAQGYKAIGAYLNGGTGGVNGTSFSSPIMCGIVACLWQAHPGRTNYQIMDAVRKSADKYNSPDSLYGYGIPNMCIADNLLSTQTLSSQIVNAFIYPNPGKGSFLIELTNNTNVQSVIIYNVQGEKVYQKNYNSSAYLNNITINADLSSGFYTVEISGTNFYKTIKYIRE